MDLRIIVSLGRVIVAFVRLHLDAPASCRVEAGDLSGVWMWRKKGGQPTKKIFVATRLYNNKIHLDEHKIILPHRQQRILERLMSWGSNCQSFSSTLHRSEILSIDVRDTSHGRVHSMHSNPTLGSSILITRSGIYLLEFCS